MLRTNGFPFGQCRGPRCWAPCTGVFPLLTSGWTLVQPTAIQTSIKGPAFSPICSQQRVSVRKREERKKKKGKGKEKKREEKRTSFLPHLFTTTSEERRERKEKKREKRKKEGKRRKEGEEEERKIGELQGNIFIPFLVYEAKLNWGF
jgi:hypothetical protein